MGVHMVIEQPDAHPERAIAIGADRALDIQHQNYGARGYTRTDLTGH